MNKDLASLISPKSPANFLAHDWESLFLEAKKEEVFPLFYRAIKQDETLATQIPKTLRQQMDQLYYTHLARNLSLLKHLKKIVMAFQEESITFYLFKGFDISLRIYGDLFARSQADLDFIVAPTDLPKARTILIRLGFSPVPPTPYEYYYEHDFGNCRIELHRSILHLRRFEHWHEPPLDIEGIWKQKTAISLEGSIVPVPNLEDLFLALTLHFAFHHHLKGLKWLTDLAWMIDRQTLNWPSLLARTKHNHLIPIFYASLKCIEDTFPISLPEGLLKSSRPRHPSILFWTRFNNSPCRYLFRLGLMPTWKNRWRMLRGTSFYGSVLEKVNWLFTDLMHKTYLIPFFTKQYEKYLGIETQESVRLNELGIEESKGRVYTPTNYTTLKSIFRCLRIRNTDVFIDFGSGKGRALMMAARFPFKKIIGVEISEELNKIAMKNMERLKNKLNCNNISLVTSEATIYDVPDDATIVFMSEPFHLDALLKVLNNIKKSLTRSPRSFTLIYNHPGFHEELEKLKWLKKVSESKRRILDPSYELYYIYENIDAKIQ